MSVCGRFFESPSSFWARPRKTGDTECRVGKKVILMRENKEQRHTSSEKRSPCEINHLFGGVPCARPGEETIDGLALCERHALEVKLEGQIACWGGMLFHIELWAREASRREREDIVGLLEVQRAEATSARQRARTDLDRLKSSDTPLGTRRALGSAEEEVLTRGPLESGSLLLPPPRGARPRSGGLGRHRRR
jgi:hypothetical protein